jgi:hypothetical protein
MSYEYVISFLAYSPLAASFLLPLGIGVLVVLT